MRVLDLGCGRGLTSIFLAREFGVRVFAVDLWVPAADNLARFREFDLEDQVIPIHADAAELPFAAGYFDAVVSVDAYHYFGSNDTYFREGLRPFLKPGALVALAFPGMRYEVHQNVPEEMAPFWEAEALEMWHSMDWWRPKFEKQLSALKLFEMTCFDRAWADWLATENPHAAGDRPMIAADNGRYMNLIGITGQVAF